MSEGYVLYVDHQGHPAPLTECFHATASRRLSSTTDARFPPSTLTEVDSAYCPQCLAFHDAASASRLRFCSKATCQRCPICVTAVATVTAQDGLCYYQCGQCDWTSQECQLTVKLEVEDVSKLELARAAEELGTDLLQRRLDDLDGYFTKLCSSWEKESKANRVYPKELLKLRSPKGLKGDWSLETLEESLEKKRKELYSSSGEKDDFAQATSTGLSIQRLSLDDEDAKFDESSLATISMESFEMQALGSPMTRDQRSELLPLPTPLRVRRSRRCRAELAEGRPGIVLKPKLNPLEGDSSLRTGHGQWWRKDSSAVHVIPRVQVTKHQVSESGNHVFLLKVLNPTLGVVRLRFASSSYQGEPQWEDHLKANASLEHVLVDTLTQRCLDLTVSPLGSLAATDSVDLLSAEDSIIEMGGKARETPKSVIDWDATDRSNSDTTMSLVAQSASDAWFELVVAPGFDASALALQLQVAVGDGLWESSLIQPKEDSEESDWVGFDLVLTWESSP